MGIPHLITHLRPYATTEDLNDLIIDGPGFAYHIYAICLKAEGDVKNPFEAIPSYEHLANIAIRWLDFLTARGVTIKKIFFDGLLPSWKRDVRIGRLRAYTKLLSSYHEAWPQSLPQRQRPRDDATVIELFPNKSIPPSASKIPAAPFLVPAIVEALQASRYADVTSVVAAEADVFCAAFAKRHGGCVLTGDSDLLVFDLTFDARVCLFQDIQAVPSRESGKFHCLQYSIYAIEKRLALPTGHGMRSLAFEISGDSHGSFPSLLQKAIKLDAVLANPTRYADFALQYECDIWHDAVDESSPNLSSTVSVRNLFTRIDPRLSEFVLPLRNFIVDPCRAMINEDASKDGMREFFLPFISDCPSRSSAWAPSTQIRQLAYALLNLKLPARCQVTSIVEHRRQGQVSEGGREFEIPNEAQLAAACDHISTQLADLVSDALLTSSNTFESWLPVFISAEVDWAAHASKTSLFKHIQATSASHARLTWDIIHFFAQIHAGYYSYRILQQVSELIMASLSQPPPYLVLLVQQLRSLPRLADLWPIDRINAWIHSEAAADMLRRLIGVLDDEPRASPATAMSRKERKKLRRKKEQLQTQKQVISDRRLASNPYGVLADDA